MSRQIHSPIVELRMYKLRKNRRDELIELFDREFIESREAVGIQVLGQFRNVDDPQSFVWLQGFKDMPARAQSLHAFYTSPIWMEHRKAANATIIDSGNVLLLHPARPDSGFKLKAGGRPPRGSTTPQDGFVAVTICYFEEPVTNEFIDFFEFTLQPALKKVGASILAYFTTEDSPNTYPRLSIREGEHVFVWFAGFRESEAFTALTESKAWSEISKSLRRYISGEPEVLRLTPTPRSWLK